MTEINKDQPKQHLIQKFNNSLRYLDDTFALNNDDFSTQTKDMQSAELTLNEANINNEHSPILDLDTKLNTKIYN